MGTRYAFAVVVASLIAMSACDYAQGARQVRTTADLQTICGLVSVKPAPLSVADLRIAIPEAVTRVNGGKDAWGNPYQWHVYQSPGGGASYLVLSTGSDGSLDVADIRDYVNEGNKQVLSASEHKRDIVFRGCEPIVTGGK